FFQALEAAYAGQRFGPSLSLVVADVVTVGAVDFAVKHGLQLVVNNPCLLPLLTFVAAPGLPNLFENASASDSGWRGSPGIRSLTRGLAKLVLRPALERPL